MPIPWSIEMEVAPVVDQLRRADWPCIIVDWFAEKLTVGGGGLTVTVTDLIVVPPEF